LLYHLVTGRYPVESASPRDLIDAHARGDRRRLRDERPDLPESFITIIERAIDPDPARRYVSAGEMEAKLSGEPATRPETVPRRPAPVSAEPSFIKRAVSVLGGTVVLTGVLGFIASRFFEVVLQIDRDLWLGFVDTFTTGMTGLLPYVVLWLFGAACLGLIAALRTLVAERIATPLIRLNALLDSADPARVATGIFLFGVVSCGVLNLIAYRDLFAALYALRDSPGDTSVDFTILGPDRNGVRVSHLLFSVYLSMLLGLAVWRWFPRLEKQSAAPIARLMKWATLAVVLIVIAWDVMPRRILWETHRVVEFDQRTRFVIASTGDEPDDELLLYMPDEPASPSVRVRRNTPGLTFLDRRWLFGGRGTQESGRSR
jgi:hypothetical protein